MNLSNLPDKEEPTQIDLSGLPDKEEPLRLSWRQGQGRDDSMLDKVFNLFSDPEKERAKVVNAIVDAEALSIRPAAAYDTRSLIDKYYDTKPEFKWKKDNILQGIKNFNDVGGPPEEWKTTLFKSTVRFGYGLQATAGNVLKWMEENDELQQTIKGAQLRDLEKVALQQPPSSDPDVLAAAAEARERKVLRTWGDSIVEPAKKKQQEYAPHVVPGSLQDLVGIANQTSLNTLSFIALAAVTGGGRYVPLMGMSAQAFVDTYGEQREGGSSKTVSGAAGLVSGLSAFATEFIPTGIYLKPKSSFIKTLFAAEASELPGETLDGIVNDVVKKLTIRPDMTVEEFMENAQTTFQVTVLSTGMNTGATYSAHKIIGKAAMQTEHKDAFRDAKNSALLEGETPQAAAKAGIDAVRATPDGAAFVNETLAKLQDEARAYTPPQKSENPFIFGVNEDANGEVASFTMADPVTGQTFDVPALKSEDKETLTIKPDMAAVAAKVQELRKSPDVEIDAQLDRLIQGKEDIDAAAGQMFGKAGQGEKTPVQNPQHNGVATLDDVYAQAREVQPAVLDITKKVADIYGAHVLTREGDGLKAIESATRKLSDADIAGNPSLITDIVGTTIALEDKTIIDAALNDLASAVEEAGGEVVSVNDKFQKEQKDGYKDVNVKIRMPNGHVVEIQLHDAKMLEAKEVLGHDIYAVTREIDSIAREKSDSRLFKLGKDLKAQSKKYYSLVSEGAEDAARLRASLSEITAASLVILEKLRGLEISSSFSPDILNNLTASLSNLKGIPSFSKYSKRDIIRPPDSHNIASEPGTVNAERGIGDIIKGINDAIGEKGSVDLMPLVDLGKTIWTEGHTTIEAFTKRAQELLGDVWDRVKDQIQKAWEAVKEFNEKLGERGSFSTKNKYDVDEVNGLLDMAARQDKAIGPLPEQPSYDEVRNKAAEMAFEKLQKKIDFQERKNNAALKRQGKDDARQLPVFQALEYMSKNGGLNKSKLLKDYDHQSIKELSKRRINLVKENGSLELDVVADQMGFESADDLYNALMDWQGLEEEGRKMADAFQYHYGDMITTAEMDNFNELLMAEEDKIMNQLTAENRPKPAKGLKTFIRQKTGQAKKTDKMVAEYDALTAMFKKEAATARQAFAEGKKEEVERSKDVMRWLVKRRDTLKNVRDYFGLTDAEMMSATSRRNPALMDDAEFTQFLKDVGLRAVELADNKQAKIELMALIEDRRLQKVDNYRRAMELPAIDNMTTEQIREFTRLLEPFQNDDIFLTQRELETVDRTDALKGTRTWREAREALIREIQKRRPEIEMKDLSAVKTSWGDVFKWDSVLREKDPFFELLVHDMATAEMAANLRIHDLETRVYDLAKKSDKSRNRTVGEKALPKDEQIMAWLEAPAAQKEAIAHQMTGEQLDYAHFMIQYFADALEYLMSIKAIEKGRENYITHVRKTFMENARDRGLLTATSEIFRQAQEDQMTFNILDDDTGKILPLEKFFQFQLHRNGGLDPTKNVTRAFMTYARTFERKKMFDAIIPKLDIYAQSLTPTVYTPRGLEIDRSLKTFVNKWINNKKGRHISFDSVIQQGGVIDVALRGAKAFTSMLDLGFFIPAQAINFMGEQLTTMVPLGVTEYAKSIALIRTEKGKRILEKYESFVGRSFWENFTAPGKQVNERLTAAMFGLFHISTVAANKQFLLASMSKEEWANEALSPGRLAEIKLDMGRFRAVPGDTSLVGSTSAGGIITQYKTWAVSPTVTLLKDISAMAGKLKHKKPGEAFTSREAREVYRVIGTTVCMAMILSMGGDDDENDRSAIGKMKARAAREVYTLTQGMDPTFWLSMRTASYLAQLGAALKNLLFLEEYKNKEGYKGYAQIKKALTPGAVRGLGDNTEGGE